jgi:ABC-type multidrug transport system ATPase subunit
MATQALDEAERTCTQLIVLSRGQLRANVHVRDLPRRRPADAGRPIADAVRILASFEGVRVAEISPEVIAIDAGNMPTAALVRALVLGGVDVSEVTMHRETLEHHFLQLTADREATVTRA